MFSFWKNQDGESPKKIYAWILLLGVIAGVALLFLGNRDDMTGTDTADTDDPETYFFAHSKNSFMLCCI